MHAWVFGGNKIEYTIYINFKNFKDAYFNINVMDLRVLFRTVVSLYQ